MSAHQDLIEGLRDALGAGLRVPCSEGEGWVSDIPAQRAVAALLCGGFPVPGECGAAADETGERFGVWAGVDRSPGSKSQASARSAS